MSMIDSDKNNWLEEALYSIGKDGYCIVENILDKNFCETGKEALELAYSRIISLIGKQRLINAGEVGVIRGPMKYDPFFFKLLENNKIQNISQKSVSETSILHLQNGFIFPSQNEKKIQNEFQFNFHRDYPRYHNGFVASINVLLTLDDIDERDEIFYVVPGAFQIKGELSQKFCFDNKISISAKAGSALVFDSTCWHCAGKNKSQHKWYGINHQFTHSYIKQQIDYVRMLGNSVVEKQSERVQQMLGYYTRVVTSLDEYYQPPEKRIYRRGQG